MIPQQAPLPSRLVFPEASWASDHSTALDVLKLSDSIFEMRYPEPARPQLEYFVQHSLEQKNYFTSY